MAQDKKTQAANEYQKSEAICEQFEKMLKTKNYPEQFITINNN